MPNLVFLLDVDNTLLNNDELKEDLNRGLEGLVGDTGTTVFWEIYEQLRLEEGVVDIPGVVRRFAAHSPQIASSAVRDMIYSLPFHAYLYGASLDVIQHLKAWGLPVILSDGDAEFQRLKIQNSGLAGAVGGRVILTTHKDREMDRVFEAYPAERYVLVDDKPSILASMKLAYPSQVTTVLVRQGKYATEPASPGADVALNGIADLANVPPGAFLSRSEVAE